MSGLAQQNITMRGYGKKKVDEGSMKNAVGGSSKTPPSSSVAKSQSVASDAFVIQLGSTKCGHGTSEDTAAQGVNKRHKAVEVIEDELGENALLEVAKDMSTEDALLAVADVMKYVARKVPQTTETLRQERDEALQAVKNALHQAKAAEKKYVG